MVAMTTLHQKLSDPNPRPWLEYVGRKSPKLPHCSHCIYTEHLHPRFHMVLQLLYLKFEPPHDKTIKMACVPSEGSDQPGHPPSLIRVFAVRIKKAWVLSYPLSALRRLYSDWADAQADLSLRWVHSHFVGFVMRRLILLKNQQL